MFKKGFLAVFAAMLLVLGASIAQAVQVDGVASGTGPALPVGLQSSINPGGLGDSLLYGYYNVRGNLNWFQVVNTNSVDGNKVRVIFRNGKNSKECLDFSVCLSRGDVWTAYLIDNGTTAAICPWDTDTLTAPAITSCIPFKFGTYEDGYVVTADDCREGYFEVVGLSAIPLYDKAKCTLGDVTCPFGSTAGAATESACNTWAGNSSVQNVLLGANTIIDVFKLATYSYNATAVADTNIGVPFAPPAGAEYSIAQAMDGGCQEFDYIFTKTNVISPFNLLAELGGQTEVIVTFPSRYVCHANEVGGIFDGKTDNDDPTKADVYCTVITPALWDDKEKKQSVLDFSPGLSLCLPHEVNIIRVGNSAIFNSTLANVITTSFKLGWIDVSFAATNHFTAFDGVRVSGVPLVSYQVQSFAGGFASYMVPTAYKTSLSQVVGTTVD